MRQQALEEITLNVGHNKRLAQKNPEKPNQQQAYNNNNN